MKHLWYSYNLKISTCYKDPENPSCIDLLSTNKNCKFKNLYVLKTSLSVFHKFTSLRAQFFKLKLRISFYRNYTKFSNETFINSLNVKLGTKSISADENGFLNFCKVCTEVLNKYAPRKWKAIMQNQSPFINKYVSKVIMKLTGLRNTYLKQKTLESKQIFVKQRSYFISLLRKLKRNYTSILNVNNITNRKKFWKSIKPLFTDKIKSVVSITLKEDKKINENQNEVANIFNDYFSKVVFQNSTTSY